jgi:hypothetical protein
VEYLSFHEINLVVLVMSPEFIGIPYELTTIECNELFQVQVVCFCSRRAA